MEPDHPPPEAYRRALRAWHIAFIERVDQHRTMFFPPEERDTGLIYEDAIQQIGDLRAAESKAWDRLLQARDVYAEHLASGGDR